MKPSVTIAMVSYKRPKFTKEAIKALKRNPGIDYEFLHWRNDKHNLGSDALRFLLDKAQGKYFVIVEEDEIWFQDNWLRDLVKAFEQFPPLTEEEIALGVKNQWGALATNCLRDDVNNGGMWPEAFNGTALIYNGIRYIINVYAGGGAIIYNTEVLRSLGGIWDKSPKLNGTIHRLHFAYEYHQYPTGIVPDIYIYHAASPYWNKLYPKVWLEKQQDQTIEDAFRVYDSKGSFNWNDERPMTAFLTGNFQNYATELWNKCRLSGL